MLNRRSHSVTSRHREGGNALDAADEVAANPEMKRLIRKYRDILSRQQGK
jgi:hypothetical protein